MKVLLLLFSLLLFLAPIKTIGGGCPPGDYNTYKLYVNDSCVIKDHFCDLGPVAHVIWSTQSSYSGWMGRSFVQVHSCTFDHSYISIYIYPGDSLKLTNQLNSSSSNYLFAITTIYSDTSFTTGLLTQTDRKDSIEVLYMDASMRKECVQRFPKTFDNVETLLDGIFVAFPNPVNDILHVEFTLPLQSFGSFEICNYEGQKVKEYIVEIADSKAMIPLNDLAAGVYFMQMSVGDFNRKMKIVKL
ncbi:MAG: T9SS type A sorting domain-containing protein [Chitinophagales bacterium]